MRLHLVADEGEIVRFRIEGEIRVTDTNERRPFEELLGNECYARTLLLDLAESRFIDSSGIGWLIVHHRLFQRGGGHFILHDVPVPIAQALAFVRMHSFLTMVPTIEEAREARRRM